MSEARLQVGREALVYPPDNVVAALRSAFPQLSIRWQVTEQCWAIVQPRNWRWRTEHSVQPLLPHHMTEWAIVSTVSVDDMHDCQRIDSRVVDFVRRGYLGAFPREKDYWVERGRRKRLKDRADVDAIMAPAQEETANDYWRLKAAISPGVQSPGVPPDESPTKAASAAA